MIDAIAAHFKANANSDVELLEIKPADVNGVPAVAIAFKLHPEMKIYSLSQTLFDRHGEPNTDEYCGKHLAQIANGVRAVMAAKDGKGTLPALAEVPKESSH